MSGQLRMETEGMARTARTMVIAVGLLIILSVVLISHEQTLNAIHAAQVRACERGNELRLAARSSAQTLDALGDLELAVTRRDGAAEGREVSAATAVLLARVRRSLELARPIPRFIDCARETR